MLELNFTQSVQRCVAFVLMLVHQYPCFEYPFPFAHLMLLDQVNLQYVNTVLTFTVHLLNLVVKRLQLQTTFLREIAQMLVHTLDRLLHICHLLIGAFQYVGSHIVQHALLFFQVSSRNRGFIGVLFVLFVVHELVLGLVAHEVTGKHVAHGFEPSRPESYFLVEQPRDILDIFDYFDEVRDVIV